ncbi:unnamed protein product [Chrysodeixis includens]|uniref:Anoctamin transmembrane domain-containing protein n=1 Tax=Chrysodeixis includens TaxID=689277 RepID=A0A9P0FUF3_CHRIL|nr:unnamed protein product [Chrysodeixis includens]
MEKIKAPPLLKDKSSTTNIGQDRVLIDLGSIRTEPDPAMEAMVAVAVLVNCALIGLSGPVHRLLPDATPAQTILVIVALEHVVLIVVLALRIAIPEIPGWLATEMAKVEFQRREAIKNSHAPLMSECTSQDDVRPSARNTPRTITPTTPKQPSNDKLNDKKKLFIGKIPEIPPFRPKAASITTTSEPPVTVTGSLQALPDEVAPGAPLSLLGVRGLRDEPLHRSAHCIPHPAQHRPLVNPTLQELSGSVGAGGSEPDLNAVPALDVSNTSSEDDKPKDKGSRSRAKAALVKRVRSVAVFSLGLRRAREAAASGDKHAHTPHTPDKPLSLPAPMLGGELSLIPIEQLIQVDDVKPRPT